MIDPYESESLAALRDIFRNQKDVGFDGTLRALLSELERTGVITRREHDDREETRVSVWGDDAGT